MADRIEIGTSALVEMLRGSDELDRLFALTAIAEAATSSRPIVLVYARPDTGHVGRFRLDEFGSDAIGPAIGPLTSLVDDPSSEVRVRLAYVLRRIGGEAVRRVVTRGTFEPTAGMTPRECAALVALSLLAEDDDPEVWAAVFANEP